MVSGGQLVVRALQGLGVTRVFCVAGESYLPVLDALLDAPSIDVITCRHESGAAFMAEAHANLTGQPGVAFVTRGPGACNGSIGLHTATQSSTPLLLFVGLIHSDDVGKEAFQEFDLPQMFGSLSKQAFVIEAPSDVQGQIEQAFHVAQSGRPGAVVLGLPEDVLSGEAEPRDTNIEQVTEHSPTENEMQTLAGFLEGAQKPLVIVGGGGWQDNECDALEKLVEEKGLPVAASFRRQDIFSHNHDCYVGEIGLGSNPKLIEYAKDADVVIVLGARISDILTQGYSLFSDAQKLVHVYPSEEVFGKAYAPALAIRSHAGPFLTALSGVDTDAKRWAGWLRNGRENYMDWTDVPAGAAGWNGADMTRVFLQLRDLLPQDTIVTTDAGNFAGWCNRYLRYGRPGRQIAPLSGSMGYGTPAAIAAAIAAPEQTVLGVCGDGGFMMTGQELATAMHHNAKPIIMVCNNSMYGTIRMHQERDFPGRVSGTDLTNPDFVKLAESYGAFGIKVEHEDEFEDAWRAAIGSGRAALIEIRMDPRQISTQSKP